MTNNDSALARRIAAEAGALLARLRHGEGDRADLGARGDRAAQDYLAGELRTHRPADAVLSEEAVDDPARLAAERVWIIDPLDGTVEFGEPGRVDWAVHVALWQAGDLAAAAVALPALDLVYATGDDLSPPAPPPGRLRIAVSRTRPPAQARRVASAVGGELVPMGSAGFKVMAVVRGEVEAYLHGGGQYEWDSAAPVAIARAAGLHTSRLDGSPLSYNNHDPRLPDLLVCRREPAERILAELAASR
ncbi:inositol monophosphatase family protein [Amycolatopsis cihanbeyliensis]|uniref:3'(2'),5'-bisphosphate nucleotidase n=1 Tax=Amycolatopsis cihanbeyliensis TaxID=1128664 RepID=A0A542DQS8_AMYCI|nr:inositol monophosphatase family protein [Amycolatopsis cihanbeyliensis]TQJ05305.1 3'(2'),5'-bisphosphate nucleotidase [Amycolatopsis cihanbeyliensis]